MFLNKIPLFENAASGLVFHYTTHTTVLEHIFHNGQIQFGKLCNTNDPYEHYVWDIDYHQGGSWNNDEDIEKLKLASDLVKALHSSCHLFCTTLDSSRANHEFLGRGFSIPSLWAHYAANHMGVCLAFDQPKLFEAVRSAAKKSGAEFFNETIEYDNPPQIGHPAFIGCDLKAIYDNSFATGILERIKKYYKTFLFTKDKTWEYENESRFAVICKDNKPFKIDISDAIVGIILGNKFPDCYFPLIEKAKEKYHIESAQIVWNKGWPILFQCP